jgi:hypothetical protein
LSSWTGGDLRLVPDQIVERLAQDRANIELRPLLWDGRGCCR